MKRAEPITTNEAKAALVICLRILARRGRAIREAAKKQTADSVSHPSREHNTESAADDAHVETRDALGILP